MKDNKLPIHPPKRNDRPTPLIPHPLAYPMTKDIANLVAEAVRNGDEPVICTEITFGCTCDKSYLDTDDE